jgi:hypothetical protein
MCTKVASQSRVVIGGTDYQFVSYLFGGFVHNKYNQLETSNDLIVVKYHRIMYDNSSQPKNGVAHYDGNEEAVYKTVTAKGRLPLPRRDHSACLMKDGQYLVVFGGKNDNAGDIKSETALSDLVIFDFESKAWSCLGQYGFKPSARWQASLCASDQREQLFLFGGSNHEEGACSNQVYCFDYNSSSLQGHLSTIRQCSDEAILLSRKFRRPTLI